MMSERRQTPGKVLKDSIYTKDKHRQNSVMIEITTVVTPWDRGVYRVARDMRGPSRNGILF